MKHIYRATTLLFVILSFRSITVAQNDTLYVEKKECQNKFKGNKLSLVYEIGDVHKESFTYGYDLDFFINLSDSIKLVFIDKLLAYEMDTTHCCMQITGYNLNGNEGCRGAPRDVKAFTLQVDALFMINRLVWPKLMELYSCSPVLYDNKLKKEINSDQEKIKCVFAEYKKWYAECKALGRIPKYFPFNDGRYVWYGGRRSIAAKE